MRQRSLHLAEQFLVVLLRSVFGHVHLTLRTRLHSLHKLLFGNTKLCFTNSFTANYA